jgi:hypothetical protein
MAKASYKKNLVQEPAREVWMNKELKGRQNPTMTFMSEDLVPGSNTYIEVGWIYQMPDPNPHILRHEHNYPEIVMHFGNDPDNPEDLGAEIEFGVGDETLKITKTSAVYIPKGVPHGPLVWKKVKRPHIQMAMMLNCRTLKDADQGGHIKKAKEKKYEIGPRGVEK